MDNNQNQQDWNQDKPQPGRQQNSDKNQQQGQPGQSGQPGQPGQKSPQSESDRDLERKRA
jgi:hypothetical protein